MTITPNFLKTIIQKNKNYPKFYVQCIYARSGFFDRNFCQKIFNPQMRILNQSQIIFSEKSKFQNCLNQQMLKPDEKHFVFEEPNYHTYFH